MKTNKLLLTLILSVAIFSNSFSNNIKVSNVTHNGGFITFDLSWENSWNDNVNHDAAWVFVKYRLPNNHWYHVTLTNTGHTAPAGSIIDTPADCKGVFIYRSTSGIGNNNFTNIMLKWDTGQDEVSGIENIQVKVIAIEMVNVPESAFWLGDEESLTIKYFNFHQSIDKIPVHIDNIEVLVKGGGGDGILSSDGILVDGDGGIDSDNDGVVDNANFPTGYKAFYCMKYEISQGQYADFLNTITASQVSERYYAGKNQRYNIDGNYPEYYAISPFRACNWLSWMDGVAYTDWAALRPMTELEYEKACRGNANYVRHEFAWGNNTINYSSNEIIYDGTDSSYIESHQNVGNASWDSRIDGPVRCGIFAYSAQNKTRVETGGSFYGIMEMTGNLWEQCVTVGKLEGRSFSGDNGDGILSENGYSNQANWTGFQNGAITSSIGSGLRGGCWSSESHAGTTSDAIHELWIGNRTQATSDASTRRNQQGFRCVRSYPSNYQ